MKRLIIFVVFFLLVGCGSLNFRTAPSVMHNCQYSTRAGVEFSLNLLPSNKKSYQSIYIAQSRASKHLSSSYAGIKGKLTDQIFTRDYPKETFWRTQSLLDRATLYDDGYDDLYISPAQKQERDRKAKFVVRQAVLQNCQIVYIAIDSLAKDKDNPLLIESNEISINK
ncbi:MULTISPECIES: hypothetical protein [unclassified Gilliamella]|uniref:hypothetical protein n=1 Tax=unclassified Gilliamella TaxID=2685620 RepID=UPI00226AD0BF|nr:MULTISPECIES: hypothetical protein [unclassified Gilliamella]MCX8642827.1 hypothetical protein [Gilliamella sp. B3835]MCX8708214.1 hypothetical protein [Gilliamella sp. B3783]MCX8710112.1 hypothetical protein [Gilliamella sp. B3780]MCX8712722.1 hypothetical protein [Gilliamella sp. B3468]MCX8715388.1 hypothetical protein [Gilliamella sp. B3781]